MIVIKNKRCSISNILKDPSLGIITDIVDGARPTTDIIF